jgi:flavin reductase (DIM6/NTAB) family NADH-FMN oxidoreductase RutF
MFYEPSKQKSGLPHNPFTACVVPRPIGWISTLSKSGIHNLAPFAQFQNVTFEPPTVLVSIVGLPAKDTLVNMRDTGEFVWNMPTYALRDKVVGSAITFPPEVNEFEALQIDTLPSRLVKPLRVAASPIHFECRVQHTVDIASAIPEGAATVVIARVVGIHISDEALTPEGTIDVVKLRPLARLGYLDYTSVTDMFHVTPPVPTDGPWKPAENLRAHPSGLFHMPEVGEDPGADDEPKN